MLGQRGLGNAVDLESVVQNAWFGLLRCHGLPHDVLDGEHVRDLGRVIPWGLLVMEGAVVDRSLGRGRLKLEVSMLFTSAWLPSQVYVHAELLQVIVNLPLDVELLFQYRCVL